MEVVPSERFRMAPAYLDRLTGRELQDRAEKLLSLQNPCVLCPHACRSRRSHGETGVCRSTGSILVASAGPHYGEEPPLVGTGGSGTIFFAGCNLRCVFCQNYDISHRRSGTRVDASELAEIMLSLQQRGCHNINLVTPTHVVPGIVHALAIAARKGLKIPLVYNCGGYESVAVLRLLDGIVDIYMPDIKYADDSAAERYSGAEHYWTVVRAALREMTRQVGTLQLDRHGIARRGVLIRHLLLPGDIARSDLVFRFIADDLSPASYVNIMDQYRPAFRAALYPELDHPLAASEYLHALQQAYSAGLRRGFDMPGPPLQRPVNSTLEV